MRLVCILVFSVLCFAQPSLSEQRSLAEGERELLNLLLTASPEVREAIQEYLNDIPPNGDWALYKQSVSAPKEWELVAIFTGDSDKENCIDAQLAISKSSHSSAVYQCIPLPKVTQIDETKIRSREGARRRTTGKNCPKPSTHRRDWIARQRNGITTG